MLKLTNLTKKYQDFTLNCSLEVRPGTITGFIGANGAGKSTTFKAIMGLISNDGGEMELFGNKRKAPTVEDKKRIGAVLAESCFSGELTVKDISRVLAAFYPSFDKKLFLEKARELSLPENKKIKEFSTGMKAKIRVLSAICHQAELLILDEPTAGLDVVARDQILDLLREYVAEDENRSILISSHISGDLEQLCDDFYMIDNGQIICHEETDRLLSDYAVLKVSDKDLETLDKSYILRRRKEGFGWSLLTDQKRYYAENCPGMVVERITMDEYIMMMLKGETL
ncbi:ABC transporter ATP-binding protein [Clostridiales bacterium FE2011]|nr:ABC transporter ATP-binding protein [Clostridiales bacterium FE2011]